MLGEKSTDEGALFGSHMSTITDGHLPIITIPGTYHHLMFDEPMAVSMTLKALMLQWLAEDNRPAMQQALKRTLEASRG